MAGKNIGAPFLSVPHVIIFNVNTYDNIVLFETLYVFLFLIWKNKHVFIIMPDNIISIETCISYEFNLVVQADDDHIKFYRLYDCVL